MLASLRYRLPRELWLPTRGIGLAALLIPSWNQHYARNLADLSLLAVLTACSFVAVAFASRSRVAHLSPWWRLRIDDEGHRLRRLHER